MGYVSTRTGEWVDDDSLDMQGLSGLSNLQEDSVVLSNPMTGETINSVAAQPQLLFAVNDSIEIEIVLAGESKTLSALGVAGYRLIVHAAIATGAVTITDDDGTSTLPVGCIGLFEFQPSGDVTLDNSSNTGGPITVLEIA